MAGNAAGGCSPSWFHGSVSVVTLACNLNIPPPTHALTSAQWLSPKAVSLLTDDTQGKALWLNHSDHFLFHSRSPVLWGPHSAMPGLAIRALISLTPRLLGRLSHPLLCPHLPGWGAPALSFSPIPQPCYGEPGEDLGCPRAVQVDKGIIPTPWGWWCKADGDK